MNKPKRLFFDIEVSPNVGLFWTAGYKQQIGYEQIIKERAIICICYKWGHERKVHSLTWDKKQSDRVMLEKFVKVANQADELVGHNGDKFDLAWVRTRCLFHGIDMMPKYVTVDTLKAARSRFKFNSNRLDYIAKFLGIGAKTHTKYDWWRDILLKNDTETLAKMVKYCIGDVKLLERVFNKLINHLPAKSRNASLNGLRIDCPECGGKTKINMTRKTAAGYTRVQRRCKECGKHHTTND